MGEPGGSPTLIGVRRFELRTSPTRTERATRLRHTPSAQRVAIIEPMAQRDEIIRYANELLEIHRFPEYGTPGLQVLGADEVTKIACGVSSSLELFERSAAAGAQLVIVHHGMFWRNEPVWIDRRQRGRLAGALRGRPEPRCVPPRARRAPRDRQQRAARRRARRGRRAAVRRGRAGRPAGRAGRHRGVRAAASRSCSVATRSSSRMAPSASSASRSARAARAAR